MGNHLEIFFYDEKVGGHTSIPLKLALPRSAGGVQEPRIDDERRNTVGWIAALTIWSWRVVCVPEPQRMIAADGAAPPVRWR